MEPITNAELDWGFEKLDELAEKALKENPKDGWDFFQEQTVNNCSGNENLNKFTQNNVFLKGLFTMGVEMGLHIMQNRMEKMEKEYRELKMGD